MEQDTHLVIDAASVEDAVEQASRQWGVPADKLRTEVVGEEKSFFGLFGKKLKVRVEPEKPLLLLKSSVFLSELLERMGLRAAPQLSENYTIGVEGQDADILVGRYGDGLKAMEYLLNLALRSPGEDPRLRLDSGGYRDRRVKTLERLAEATARRVVQRGAPLRLEPMLSWERWVIHTTLKDRDDVETQSVGEAPDRKVVIMPKLGAAERSESARPGGAVRNHAPHSRYRR
ncbi:MAG: Jag N-terminal domain-containing protein [Synergistaceae bacterium]|nr:Jag N-terminal domain-containing protein [Synergistaceae bacterium]